VIRAEEVTAFPACLDGRVQTPHPRAHPGRLPWVGGVVWLLGLRHLDGLMIALY